MASTAHKHPRPIDKSDSELGDDSDEELVMADDIDNEAFETDSETEQDPIMI